MNHFVSHFMSTDLLARIMHKTKDITLSNVCYCSTHTHTHKFIIEIHITHHCENCGRISSLAHVFMCTFLIYCLYLFAAHAVNECLLNQSRQEERNFLQK
jgi:hypothetical protein